MATPKQRKLAQAIVKNSQLPKPKNLGVLLESVGYSTKVAKAKPGEIIAQPGVQEELNALGFSEENAKLVVGTVLLNSKEAAKDRLKAAELVFKVAGSFAPEQSKEVPTVLNIFHNPNILLATQMYEANLKELITNGTTQPVQSVTQEANTDNA